MTERTTPETCPTCKGRGYIEHWVPGRDLPIAEDCPDCSAPPKRAEPERWRDEMLRPAPAGPVMPDTPGDLARPRPEGVWSCPSCGTDLTDAVGQIVKTALSGARAKPAPPDPR